MSVTHYFNPFLMKNLSKIILALFVVISISMISCTASKKGNCGCPNKQGMVGY